jgi:hypothetical protein
MDEILSGIERAFAERPRPEHFTNERHCCECAEHDETLRAHDPATIGCEQLPPAWDPMCFATVEGYLYYLPGLARLALGGGQHYFLDQFLFHLRTDRICALRAAERRAVLRLLHHFLDERLDEVMDGDLDLLDTRIHQLEGVDAQARIPALVRALFYAIKGALDDPYQTPHAGARSRPSAELSQQAGVPKALLEEVQAQYRIDAHVVEGDAYRIELSSRADPTRRFRASRDALFIREGDAWRRLGGYLQLDGEPLGGRPLDGEGG